MQLKTIASSVMLMTSSCVIGNAMANQIDGYVDLTKVTVFLRGAELQGNSVIDVPKGESEIILSGVANSININSINVGVGDKAVILSTSLTDDYIINRNKEESASLKSLKTKLEELEQNKQKVTIDLSVINEEIALLKDNRIDLLTKSNGTLSDAKQAINFVKDNLTAALTAQNQAQIELAQLNKDIVQYQSQINLEEGYRNSLKKAIKLKVYTEDAMSLPISVTYISSDAGWEPIYDIRVTNIDSPLQLTYKANVYQNTGLSWEKIDFSLSTANPSEGITAPILSPWYINLYTDSGKNGYNNSFVSATPLMKQSNPALNRESVVSHNMIDYVTTDNNGLNLEFNVTLPYTIYSASRSNVITLKQKDVTAKYRYIATPKLDNNAFLQAEIFDWDKLSLLPGKSTVYYAGNYMGEGYVTTKGVKDNLYVSLGRDKEIIINRNQDLNETSKPSFFGNDVSQKFAYTIDVRNTKALPIDLTIFDQLPVIQDKTIKLDDEKYQSATYDNETGLLTWKLNLKASEVKQLPFSFKLTYPKTKESYIVGL